MLDVLKFMAGIVKDEIEKTAKEYVDDMLYSKPYDFTKVVGYSGGGNGRIRVIGPIVTIY